ncbi:MAG: energy transducer TonB, partial [Pseudomonadota bacterium]
AFEAARRAIIRCGAKGFDLPSEKYDQWKEIEMTFNPEQMRTR